MVAPVSASPGSRWSARAARSRCAWAGPGACPQRGWLRRMWCCPCRPSGMGCAGLTFLPALPLHAHWLAAGEPATSQMLQDRSAATSRLCVTATSPGDILACCCTIADSAGPGGAPQAVDLAGGSASLRGPRWTAPKTLAGGSRLARAGVQHGHRRSHGRVADALLLRVEQGRPWVLRLLCCLGPSQEGPCEPVVLCSTAQPTCKGFPSCKCVRSRLPDEASRCWRPRAV